MGLAVGQTVTLTASPLPLIKARQGIPDWNELARVVSQWKPDALVIGMPFNMDGTSNEMTKKAGRFITQLEARFKLPCFKMDERLSTREAREIGRANAEAAGKRFDEYSEVDSLAAQLILESFLNERSS